MKILIANKCVIEEKADAEINEQIQKQLKDEKTKRAEAKRKAKEDKAKSHNAST